eukprot:Nk52_evm59s2192 gene=Nk52_evmTU59s2192
MNLLRSIGNSLSGAGSSSSSASSPFSAKAGRRLKTAEKHWAIINKELAQINDPLATNVEDTAIPHHLNSLCFLVCEESQDCAVAGRGNSPKTGGVTKSSHPCMDFLIYNNVFENFVSMTISDCPKNITCEVAKSYEYILKNFHDRRKLPKIFYETLRRFLRCSRSDMDNTNLTGRKLRLVRFILSCVQDNVAYIDKFIERKRKSIINYNQETSSNVDYEMSLSLLWCITPYIHAPPGYIRTESRNLLFLVMSLSNTSHDLAKCIVDNSSVCQIVSGGLSALYSRLPNGLMYTPSQDISWLIACTPGLDAVLECLSFCDMVIQRAHSSITKQMMTIIHDGFLNNVVIHALHQPGDSSYLAAVTYFNAMLQYIEGEVLMKCFLNFILTAEYDSTFLLDTICSRILSNGNEDVVVGSLHLVNTLFLIRCEEIQHNMVFKYLTDYVDLPLNAAKCSECSDFNMECPISDQRKVGCSAILKNASVDLLGLLHPLATTHSPDLTSFDEYLNDAYNNIYDCFSACSCWSNLYSQVSEGVTFNSNPYLSDITGPLKFSQAGKISKLDSNADVEQYSYLPKQPEQCSHEYSVVLVLLVKLKGFLTNSKSVNLLLTGIIYSLACYSQSVLRNYIFYTCSHKTAEKQFDPFVNPKDPMGKRVFLFSILGEISSEIVQFKNTQPHFEKYLTNGRVHLSSDAPDEPSTPPRKTSSTLSSSSSSARKSSNSKVRFKETVDDASEEPYLPVKNDNHEQIRMYQNIILFEEFLKELFALSEEHLLFGHF